MLDIRTRIDPDFREHRARNRWVDEERQRMWEARLHRIREMDEQDERHLAMGQGVRSVLNAQKRGIERLYLTMTDIELTVSPVMGLEGKHRDVFGFLFKPLIDSYFNQIVLAKRDTYAREAGNRKDVKQNFLYQEWLNQLKHVNSIQTYPVYALFISIKAVVAFVSERTNFAEYLDPELRGRIIQWKESPQWEPNNPSSVIGHGSLIPGLLEAAQVVMMRYGDFVRSEREGVDNDKGGVVRSPLPDDPGNEGAAERYELPLDIRLENGYQAYLSKEGSAKQIAKRYELPRDKFVTFLKERAAVSPHGGDRRGRGK